MISRRSFIKILASVSPIFLPQFKWFSRLYQNTNSKATENLTGEIYAGFIILPENAPMPKFITPGKGISLEGNGTNRKGKSVLFGNISDISDYVHFPIFYPSQLPINFNLSAVVLYQVVETNEIWAVRLDFSSGTENEGQITLWALPDFPRPFPVWPIRDPKNPEGDLILPAKVQLTSPGLMIPSMLGYDFTWITGDILYSLAVENHPDYLFALNMARSLQQFVP